MLSFSLISYCHLIHVKLSAVNMEHNKQGQTNALSTHADFSCIISPVVGRMSKERQRFRWRDAVQWEMRNLHLEEDVFDRIY